jgi:FAD binding domain-containing protein/berberine-like enzyme
MERRSFVRGLASFAAVGAVPCNSFATTLSRAVLNGNAPLSPLSKALHGAIYLPGHPEYEKLRHGFAAKVDHHPALIVHATDADDVVAAVKFAREQKLPLAIRGGGHSYAGYNSCDRGLVIDLSGLRNIAVHAERGIVRVGGGALSGVLEQETAKSGYATVLGQCPSVGVGGFLLGGGVGPLMSRYGLGCDNVLAAEVVLADGRVITASASEHPDLYWAIRGGGGNFGVVTTFTLKLHRVSEVLAGYLEYRSPNPTELLHVLRDLAAAAPDEMTLIATLTPAKGSFALSVQVCHVGEEAAGQAALEPLLKSKLLSSNGVKRQPYLALEQMVPFDVPPVYWENRGGFFPALSDRVINLLAAAITRGPGIYDELSFIQLHGAVTRVPLSATAFPMRSNGFAYGIASTWLPATGAGQASNWVNQTADSLARFGRGVYVNVMGLEGPMSVRRAYDSNYARLATSKRKFDPSNLFSINQNIKPA